MAAVRERITGDNASLMQGPAHGLWPQPLGHLAQELHRQGPLLRFGTGIDGGVVDDLKEKLFN